MFTRRDWGSSTPVEPTSISYGTKVQAKWHRLSPSGWFRQVSPVVSTLQTRGTAISDEDGLLQNVAAGALDPRHWNHPMRTTTTHS